MSFNYIRKKAESTLKNLKNDDQFTIYKYDDLRKSLAKEWKFDNKFIVNIFDDRKRAESVNIYHNNITKNNNYLLS